MAVVLSIEKLPTALGFQFCFQSPRNVGWIICAGVTHFNPKLAFSFPPGAFHLSSPVLLSLAPLWLIANYDYWGYYNVAFLGGVRAR